MGDIGRFRVVIPLLVLALSSALLAGCTSVSDTTREVVQRYVDALNAGDSSTAAQDTSDPTAAATAIDGVRNGMDVTDHPVTYTITDTNNDAGFSLQAQWDLGNGDNWTYTTTGSTEDSDGGRVITWDPAVLVPGLTTDTSVVLSSVAPTTSGRILDSSGRELMTRQLVTIVNVGPDADSAAVAALLSGPVPTITADSIASSVAAASPNSAGVVSLRQEDVAPIRSQLAALPGVTLIDQLRLLTVDRALASPALADLTDEWNQQEDRASGWSVDLRDANGAVTSNLWQAAPGTFADISTTLDLTSQLAAENALASVSTPAAIVAIRPSTGGIVAVAQSPAGDAAGSIALTGLYPPGSTFKTVTATAALTASNGSLTPDTMLACPGTANIEGRTIPNDDNFDLGTVPLHTAFARSCNTTMGRLAVDLPPDALANTALSYGLGVDYVTPGLTTVTGSVPIANTPAERVEAGIGQGQVTASPFGMAVVAASIAHGTTPMPMIINGQPATADQTTTAIDPAIVADLRTMMRETVTAGTATSLADIPDLLGKTGTAESDGNADHGWFIGIKDDLAFAVLVTQGGSSAPALAAAGSFLR
ncbi:penicillin-binding transpeptidase domain-containing protein [Millisia brevis]|uniref:penicillin-binding transpeptidase domain-containing protein n=1 Tax=Millisia brevis TaxID=264148 RepID=UPI0008336D3C|nr:penicillin-binding transpeptidase domain-containing protein [Millisia brevis]